MKQPYYEYHINAFKSHFNQIETFYYKDFFRKNSLSDFENEIKTIIKKKNIGTLILWQWYTTYIPTLEFLQALRKKIFVVLWLFDDEIFCHSHGKFYAQVSDAVVTTDYYGKIMYEQLSIPSIYYLSSYDKNTYKPSHIDKDIDISFVGDIGKGSRREYIEFLIQHGLNVETFGPNTKNGYVSEEKMVEIFNRSKINLNFTKIDFPTKILNDHPLVPRIRQNKGRPVEIGLSHAFCLSEYSASLVILFNQNEIDTFDSKEELLKKTNQYLHNNKLRHQYSDNLYQKCLKHYEKEIYLTNVFLELNHILEKKEVSKINYYEIYRNNSYTIKEKSFFLKHAIIQILWCRNLSSFFESFTMLCYRKPYLIPFAFFDALMKTKYGDAK